MMWVCPACTFENEEDSVQCNICASQRPGSVLNWSCRACTFEISDVTIIRCPVCGTTKYSSTSMMDNTIVPTTSYSVTSTANSLDSPVVIPSNSARSAPTQHDSKHEHQLDLTTTSNSLIVSSTRPKYQMHNCLTTTLSVSNDQEMTYGEEKRMEIVRHRPPNAHDTEPISKRLKKSVVVKDVEAVENDEESGGNNIPSHLYTKRDFQRQVTNIVVDSKEEKKTRRQIESHRKQAEKLVLAEQKHVETLTSQALRGKFANEEITVIFDTHIDSTIIETCSPQLLYDDQRIKYAVQDSWCEGAICWIRKPKHALNTNSSNIPDVLDLSTVIPFSRTSPPFSTTTSDFTSPIRNSIIQFSDTIPMSSPYCLVIVKAIDICRLLSPNPLPLYLLQLYRNQPIKVDGAITIANSVRRASPSISVEAFIAENYHLPAGQDRLVTYLTLLRSKCPTQGTTFVIDGLFNLISRKYTKEQKKTDIDLVSLNVNQVGSDSGCNSTQKKKILATEMLDDLLDLVPFTSRDDCIQMFDSLWFQSGGTLAFKHLDSTNKVAEYIAAVARAQIKEFYRIEDNPFDTAQTGIPTSLKSLAVTEPPLKIAYLRSLLQIPGLGEGRVLHLGKQFPTYSSLITAIKHVERIVEAQLGHPIRRGDKLLPVAKQQIIDLSSKTLGDIILTDGKKLGPHLARKLALLIIEDNPDVLFKQS